jgi:hypothetical protein
MEGLTQMLRGAAGRAGVRAAFEVVVEARMGLWRVDGENGGFGPRPSRWVSNEV